MDDKVVRNISDSVLDKILNNLNNDFLNELPASPRELAKYATRRVDPCISDNITYSLGQSMLSHRLSDEDYLITFFKVIHESFYGKNPTDTPDASVLLSQTGAGKTNLKNELFSKNENAIIINPDLYKKFRPDINEILKEDPTHLGALTGIDSYDHSNNIRNFAINKRYSLLFECAPSEKQGLIGIDLEKLYENNYDINFHILAVGDLLSSLAIHYRYEKQIKSQISSSETKLTDLSRHDESYKGVVSVLKNLPNDKISIYRRGNKDEKYMPQLIYSPNIKLNTSIHQIIEILKLEREKSNYKYAFNTSDSTFQMDFNKIKESMLLRKAPSEQFEQLQRIYDRYVTYLNYTKYMEDTNLFL